MSRFLKREKLKCLERYRKFSWWTEIGRDLDMGSDFRYSKAPKFLKKPRSTEAYEGDDVVILCEVIGDPKPELFWLRDFLKVSKSNSSLKNRLCGYK